MPRKKSKTYSWDFETTVDPNDCRVWAWASVNVDDFSDVAVGTTIESFIEFISTTNCKGSFHNLKFDGEFIITWLLNNGYKHTTTKEKIKENEFYTLISDKGQFYQIIIQFKNSRVTITDSFKLLPFKVEKIAKDFGLPISKLKINYVEARKKGHILTQEEHDYVVADAKIVAMALKILRDNGMSKMTIGSNALANYRAGVGKNFRYLFPVPDNDSFIRKSYKGGFVYANPLFAGKTVGAGIVLDVNSLYPSVMFNPDNYYPVGNGFYYDGKYVYDPVRPLYIQRIMCSFKVKKNHLPTIQIKGAFSGFIPTQYLTSSKGQIVELTLTCIDLQLFFDHYEVFDLVYVDGFKYEAKTQLFTDYVVYWSEAKAQAKRDGNKSLYTLAKLMLNNLYGKFSTNPICASKIPYLDNGVVKYAPGEKEKREPVYIPVGTFVTAYARNVTIRAAQKLYFRFLYADTDSLHLLGTDIPTELDINDYKLGAWKHESSFTKGKYLRAKTYMEQEIKKECNGFLITQKKITVAGMPSQCYSQVTFDNFKIGAVYTGKLRPVHVPGGIVLDSTTFKIR